MEMERVGMREEIAYCMLHILALPNISNISNLNKPITHTCMMMM